MATILPSDWGGQRYDIDADGFPRSPSCWSSGSQWFPDDDDGGGSSDDNDTFDGFLVDEDGWNTERPQSRDSWDTFQKHHRRIPVSSSAKGNISVPRHINSSNAAATTTAPFASYPTQKFVRPTNKKSKKKKKTSKGVTSALSTKHLPEHRPKVGLSSHTKAGPKRLDIGSPERMPWELPSMIDSKVYNRSLSSHFAAMSQLQPDGESPKRMLSFAAGGQDEGASVSTTSTKASASSVCSVNSKLAQLFHFGCSPQSSMKKRKYKAFSPKKSLPDTCKGIVAIRRKWLQEAFTAEPSSSKNKPAVDTGGTPKVSKRTQWWESKWNGSDGESQVTPPTSRSSSSSDKSGYKNNTLSRMSKATARHLDSSQQRPVPTVRSFGPTKVKSKWNESRKGISESNWPPCL